MVIFHCYVSSSEGNQYTVLGNSGNPYRPTGIQADFSWGKLCSKMGAEIGGSVLSIKPFHLQVPIPARWSVACSLKKTTWNMHHHMTITIQTVLFFWVLSYCTQIKNGRFLRHLLSGYIIAIKLPLVAIPHHTYHLVWYSPALGISTGHWVTLPSELISSPLICNTIPGFWYWIQTPFGGFVQWPFQDPKMEVPTIYKAYVMPM